MALSPPHSSPRCAAPFSWRSATLEDVPALEQLQLMTNGGSLDPWERTQFHLLFAPDRDAAIATLCAADPGGRIVAYASTIAYSLPGEQRADLDTMVAPELRDPGLEGFLISWAESQARHFLADLPTDRPATLRIAFTDRRGHALSLYDGHGFRLTFTADIMRYRLDTAIPEPCILDGTELAPWSAEYSDGCYDVYRDAFGTRPGYTCWSRDLWQRALIDLPIFHPHISRVLIQGDRPAGYILCGVEQGRCGRDAGRFIHLGVRPEWQRRGAGTGLLLSTLRAYQAQGLDEAILEVNGENPGARRLYLRLGFRQAARLHILAKPAGFR